jgi:hypothetical protein
MVEETHRRESEAENGFVSQVAGIRANKLREQGTDQEH